MVPLLSPLVNKYPFYTIVFSEIGENLPNKILLERSVENDFKLLSSVCHSLSVTRKSTFDLFICIF